jgi:nucleoside-diphosphate-sugar epimerase
VRALVTGATGFVGSHLTRALVARGDDVHALARASARRERLADLTDGVTFHEDPGGVLDDVVTAARPDATFHLATHFVAEHAPDDVASMVAANVAFPTRLADALARVAPGARFVNAGTAWQHVGGARYRPKNLYAATKQAFEDVLAAYAVRGELQCVTLDLYDTYGPDDPRGKLVDVLVRALRTGEPLAVGSGRPLLDLVHVRDAVAAFCVAAEQPLGPEATVYAVSSGAPVTVRELVDVLADVAGKPVPVQWGARPDRAGDMVTYWDTGLPLPGWAPAVDLRTGLAELLNSGS